MFTWQSRLQTAQLSDKITFWRDNAELARADRSDFPLNYPPAALAEELCFTGASPHDFDSHSNDDYNLFAKGGPRFRESKVQNSYALAIPDLVLDTPKLPPRNTDWSDLSQPETWKMQIISLVVLKLFSVHVRTNVIKSDAFWIWSHCSICSSLSLTHRSISFA